MKRSKAYRQAMELIEPDKFYTPLAAARVAKQTAKTKFDPTVEVSMRLGVDPRKADQMVRGTVNLPHGTGKTARVIVFAAGAAQARVDAIRRAQASRRLVNRDSGQGFGQVSFSAGVTEIADYSDMRSALARADAALYRAKEKGRNRVEIG